MEKVSDNRHRLSTANTRQLTPVNQELTTIQRQGHSTINSKHRQPTPENQQQKTSVGRYNGQKKRKNPTTDNSETKIQKFINFAKKIVKKLP